MTDNTHTTSTWTRTLTSAALLALMALAAFAAPRASAISDAEELTRFGSLGSGAGQLAAPRSIGTDPVTGHVFTTDNNSRISEFTAWGNFVKAFGWDVAPGAVNEQQEVRLRASTGQFKLTFNGSPTTDLAFNAPGSASEGGGSVEAALNALPSIGDAGGEVSVQAVPGTPDGATPYVYVIAFKGSLAGTNVNEITVSNGATPLGGGDPSTTLEVRTRADGTAGGTGLESCTEESGCKVGLQGSGAGQFVDAVGLVVDAAGNIYAKEERRVQKFDSAGRFVLMFGGEVDKTTNANICTFVSGDQCGAGVAGTAPGQFSAGLGLALGTGGQLFAADNERIQRFNLQGEFEASIPVPGRQVLYLAFDPVSKDLYATYAGGGGGVRKLDSTSGTEIIKLAGGNFFATDPIGNLYAQGPNGNEPIVVQYDSSGKPLSPPICCKASPPPSNPFARAGSGGLGTNAAGDLYVSYTTNEVGSGFLASFIRLFGPGPVIFEAPPKVPPTISAQYATSVDRGGAVLGAEINPHFWINTRFYIEYGTGKCSEGGCETLKPLPPGAILSTKPTGDTVKSAGVFLEGLKPGTTYHYRFVAESSGGGPVRGIGGKVGIDGEESSFTTYPAAAPFKVDCPNQAFRTGLSASLPDCRAHEMVSPIEKNNGDIKALVNGLEYTTSLDQSSTDGEKFTYSSYRAFAGAEAGAYTMQYMAERKNGVGWASKSINPPQAHAAGTVTSLDNAYSYFSGDLCNGWLISAAEPVPAPGAPPGYRDIYRRDNCGAGGYESLNGAEPTVGFTSFNIEFQGASADGKEAIFRVRDKLTPDAASGVWQTYYASEGELHLVCVLPNGTTSGAQCSGGTGHEPFLPDQGRQASVVNAISADGRRVYWTDFTGDVNMRLGKVYLRLNPGEEQSELSGGKCTEADKACTVEVSGTESSKAAEFLGASRDGERALFEVVKGVQAGNLYLFDLASGESTLIAKKVGQPEVEETFLTGLLGASENLSHVYFVSEEVLPETAGATSGKPNLYLDHEGIKTFIATLSPVDVVHIGAGSAAFSNTSSMPFYHVGTVSPDGSHLAFVSSESLTGYDNTDQVTGKADAEVYLYEAGAAGPLCVSCNPSGAQPRGQEVKGNGNFPGVSPTAAMIPPPQFMLQFPRVLSTDGRRLFFDSYDALLPRDTNGKMDVYEWEAASGSKDCEGKGAELYVEGSGGCLSLISSGQSPSDSSFLDASEDGDDVFFTTTTSLLPQDPGLIDIYDARVNGGLPGAPESPGPCQGEACQFAPPPPNDPTPASASFKGAGNPKPAPRCRKGKVARKGRCVAKKRKASKRHAKRDANHNRGASR